MSIEITVKKYVNQRGEKMVKLIDFLNIRKFDDLPAQYCGDYAKDEYFYSVMLDSSINKKAIYLSHERMQGRFENNKPYIYWITGESITEYEWNKIRQIIINGKERLKEIEEIIEKIKTEWNGEKTYIF